MAKWRCKISAHLVNLRIDLRLVHGWPRTTCGVSRALFSVRAGGRLGALPQGGFCAMCLCAMAPRPVRRSLVTWGSKAAERANPGGRPLDAPFPLRRTAAPRRTKRGRATAIAPLSPRRVSPRPEDCTAWRPPHRLHLRRRAPPPPPTSSGTRTRSTSRVRRPRTRPALASGWLGWCRAPSAIT